MDQNLLELIDLANRLGEAEKKYLEFTYEVKRPEKDKEFGEYLAEIYGLAQDAEKLKTEIEKKFIEINLLVIQDEKVKDILLKVKSNHKFYSIEAYKVITEILNKGQNNNLEYPLSLNDKLFDYIWEEFLDDFHSNYSLSNYYIERIHIGPLIVSSQVPRNIISYYDEIRENFCLGMYRSAIALCRALLEMALFIKLNSKQIFNNNKYTVVNINLAKEDNFFKYINTANKVKILNEIKANNTHKLRIQMNKVLHVKETDTVPAPKKEETLELIKETCAIIEYLSL